jgi:hypothetical protein
MFPLFHFIISLIPSIFLFPYIKWNVLFIIIGGILIDVDHYFYYIIRFRNLNFFSFYNYHLNHKKEKYKTLKDKRFKRIILIFHTIEFIFLLLILMFFNRYIFYLGVGMIIHLFFDSIQRIVFVKDLNATPLSILLYIIKKSRVLKRLRN